MCVLSYMYSYIIRITVYIEREMGPLRGLPGFPACAPPSMQAPRLAEPIPTRLPGGRPPLSPRPAAPIPTRLLAGGSSLPCTLNSRQACSIVPHKHLSTRNGKQVDIGDLVPHM